MITICCVYFRSLSLVNLDAALYGISKQDFSRVDSVVVVDNNTDDAENDIWRLIESYGLPVPVRLYSMKHGDPTKTHAWSTNFAARQVETEWMFMTRADYLLDPSMVSRCADAVSDGESKFVTSRFSHLEYDVDACERAGWRDRGPHVLHGPIFDYGHIDAGTWLMKRADFFRVGGLDERFTAWGHAQTEFQYRVHVAGVPFVLLSPVLYRHPMHAGDRDLALAHRQLASFGRDIKQLWARYEGQQPY